MSADLPPDEQHVREETLRKLQADPERYLADYTREFGNVLNADNAATLFDEYNQDRARYREAVHPAATWIRDELFRRALAERAPAGRNRVVFTAGGNAAGKSTALTFTGMAAQAVAVFDSTFSNPEHARRLVEQVLATGKGVSILYVTRPLEEILGAMLDRAELEGRVVTIDQMIGSHRGAAQGVRALYDEFDYDDGVEFSFVDNSAYGPRQGLIELTDPKDYTSIRERLNEILKRERQSGRISQENYARIRGNTRG
ncbi:MAG: zeta toxin family protein [Candidatus Solibacter sp.]